MSTTVEVILIAALVLGLVALVFGLVHLWNSTVEGTSREQRIDGFVDRLSDRFFDR
ncbi:hypothetical protein [Tsukamurella ocularis]|uniref:hypothetical protein n=1 Tax=Tsukamurella ocularis TaxID=1970234 RepID=UPI00216946A1|nr:hypothetical protein [Tsukamurella ocularis]MCS3778695.1 hypothetical protein [Tsukamurella ocularis]MCS3789396.1 hypothetical protein [Tsukamurella ocularis]MCS3851378.1 hypothetical protein [Tsukamurella ocularis]